jgi:putative autoinducer-2 (AI-2) aldolase
VWQSPHPVAMMRALNAVVHDEASPKQAFDLFKSLQNT